MDVEPMDGFPCSMAASLTTGLRRMWRTLILSPRFSMSWMMWKPNSDSTIFDTFLGSVRLKATWQQSRDPARRVQYSPALHHCGPNRVLRIETCQRRERGLTLVDAVGILAQSIFHAIDFLLLYARCLRNNLHLHLCGHKRNAVLRQVSEVAAHLGRRDADVPAPMFCCIFWTIIRSRISSCNSARI